MTDWGQAARGKGMIMNGNQVPQIGCLGALEYQWDGSMNVEEDASIGITDFSTIPWLPSGPHRRDGASPTPRLQMLFGPEEYLEIDLTFQVRSRTVAGGTSGLLISPSIQIFMNHLSKTSIGPINFREVKHIEFRRATAAETFFSEVSFNFLLDVRENRETGITDPVDLSYAGLPHLVITIDNVSSAGEIEWHQIWYWKTIIKHYQGPRTIQHDFP